MDDPIGKSTAIWTLHIATGADPNLVKLQEYSSIWIELYGTTTESLDCTKYKEALYCNQYEVLKDSYM